MNRMRMFSVVVALAAGFCLPRFVAAEDSLPTGEQILANYVKSTGGKDAYLKVKNRVEKGSFSSQGMSMTFTKYTAAPDKLYMALESEATGKIEQGTDGKVAWAISMMGPQIVDGPQKDVMIRQAFFQREVNWRDLYLEAKCEALTDFDGTPCYKVVLTPKSGGSPETEYYEKDTFLRRGGETELENPMGKVAVVNKLKDYKEVGGILYPHTVEQSMKLGQMSQDVAITLTSIEHNADLAADRFALPEKITALVAEKKDAPAKDGEAKDDKKPDEPKGDKGDKE